MLNATGEPSDEIAVTTQAFGNLSQAANHGVQPYTQLKDIIVNTGVDGHHIIEQRFAPALGQISIVQVFFSVNSVKFLQRFVKVPAESCGYVDGKGTAHISTATTTAPPQSSDTSCRLPIHR